MQNGAIEVNELINAKEVAKLIHIAPRTVVEVKRHEKNFPKARKPGREYLWYKKEIIQWFDRCA